VKWSDRIAIRGIRYNFVEKGGITLLGIAELYILIRLIEQSDFGLIALMNMVLFFGTFLSDMGLSNSIIHRKVLTKRQLSSLFWLYVAAGSLITIIVFMISPALAIFFDAPELLILIRVASFSILINSLGSLYWGVLYKELKFKYLSVLNLSVNALKFIVVCTLAFTGWGVWAIVAGLIVKSTAKTIGFVIATKSIFRPAWYFNYLSIKEDVRFGVYQTGESLVNLLHQRVDTLIIGKFLGLEVLGVYDLMKNILMKVYKMINPIFTTVSIPMLARVKDESRKTIALYLEQIQMLSFFNFPIYILLLFYDELFFDFFLKPEWERQGYHLAFGLLDIFYLLSSILNPIGSLVIAHGAVRSSFRYNLMVAVLLPTILLMLAALGGGLAILVLAMVIFRY
jgi:O-antigen/teichoic acid export membrane protein